MHRRWLSWSLLSTAANAFYPYSPTDDNSGKEKRFYPVAAPENEETQNAGVTLDLKKVPVQVSCL